MIWCYLNSPTNSEIPFFPPELTFFYSIYKPKKLDSYPNELNTVQIVTHSLLNISFNVILFLPQGLPNNLFPSGFSARILLEFLLFLNHDNVSR